MLSSMFGIGLLMTLVIAVTANLDLEYNDEVEKQLPYFEAIAEQAPALDFTLKNSDANVLWERIFHPEDIRFAVTAGKTDSNELKTSSKAVDPCGDRPWILATLQKDKYTFLQFLGLAKPQPTAFCLHRIHIRIIKRRTHPRVRLIVRFRNPYTREVIGVEMDVFKPPKNEADTNYERKVLQVDSPIPPEEFTKPSLQASDYKKQSFVSDISWMKNVLPRARYFQNTRMGEQQRYAEWYTAGPISVRLEELKNILGLEPTLENRF